jgi:hypothetical protein
VTVVVVAPGQGSQTPGFLAPWLAEPRFADHLTALADASGLDLARLGTEADADEIRDTAVAQPLIVAASLLAFGVPRAQAEEALGRVSGTLDDRSTNEECGAGTMEFTRFDAMTLNFQDGKFVGWFLGNEPGADQYSTISGIAIGTTRAKAAESVTLVMMEDSTLGEEFSLGTGENSVGGMFAAPGDAAKIDAMFAGMNCFFR